MVYVGIRTNDLLSMNLGFSFSIDLYDDCEGSEWVHTHYSETEHKYIVDAATFDSISVPNVKNMNVTDAVKKDLETARRLAPKNPELDRPDADICRAAFIRKEPQP